LPNMCFDVSKENKLAIMPWLVAQFNIPKAKVQHFDGPPSSLGNPNSAIIINDLSVKNFEQFFGDGTHEVGHAFYKTNLPQNEKFSLYERMPLSTGFDEGQAYLSENYLHQDHNYMSYFCDVLNKKFGVDDTLFNPQQLTDYHYKLRTSANRLECDDLTNLLYINALIDIEKSVIAGEKSPSNIPKLWAERLTPIIGANAVAADPYGYARTMQWSAGLIGNFAGYMQGHKAAPQIWAAMQAQIPDFNQSLVEGDLSTYRDFLINNFYQHGSQKSEQTLFEQSTGSALNSNALMADWGKKYAQPSTNPL
jgi:carboxypeptidase Taq